MVKLFFGYVKLFLKHIIRSCLIAALTLLAAGLVSFLLAALFELIFVRLFGVSFSLWEFIPFLIMNGILSLVGAICSVGTIGQFGFLKFEWDGFSFLRSRRYPKYSALVLQLVVHLLLFGVGCVLCFWIWFEEIADFYASGGWNRLLPMAFPAMFFTQVCYVWFGCTSYKDERCDKCKHVFCMNRRAAVSGGEYDTYDYTEKTKRENVGTIKAGRGKIDVYANVTRGKITATHHAQVTRSGSCSVCGDSYYSKGNEIIGRDGKKRL